MKRFSKWIGIVLSGAVGLTLLAGLVLYPIGMKKLTKTYPNIMVESVNIPTDADAIARGRHVSAIWACTKCHGEDLSGRLLTNDPVEGIIPTFGAIPAPNLTSGKGGIGQAYTDTDWVRAIRHGIKANDQAEIYMYVSTLSDQDLGDLIAYLKQIPSVDTDSYAISYGPIIPIAPALGIFTPAAEVIDHSAPRPADPVPGATVEYGKYLFAICLECHTTNLAGSVKRWSQEDFVRAVRTGILPNGKQLSQAMSPKTFGELNDTELHALWLYFRDIKP